MGGAAGRQDRGQGADDDAEHRDQDEDAGGDPQLQAAPLPNKRCRSRASSRAPISTALRISVLEMLDEDVRSRKDLGFAAVLPSDEIGRRPVLAEHLDHLGIALRLPLAMPADDQAIAGLCSQHGTIRR